MFFCIFIFSLALGGPLTEEDPSGFSPAVQAINLANKTKSNISLILFVLCFALLFGPETQFLALMVFFGTIIFVVVAQDPLVGGAQNIENTSEDIGKVCRLEDLEECRNATVYYQDQYNVLNEEFRQCKTNYSAIESEKNECVKKRDECLQNLGKVDVKKMNDDCDLRVGSKQSEYLTLSGEKDELQKKYDELEAKYKQLEREKNDCVEGKIIQPVNLVKMRDKLLEDRCSKVTQVTFADALAIAHPEMYSTPVKLEVAKININLDQGTKDWIDAVIERLKATTTKEEFYSLTNNFFNTMKQQTDNCVSAVKTVKQIKYFESKIDATAINRMLNVYSNILIDDKVLSVFGQLVHFCKSWFLAVEPIDYSISSLTIGCLIGCGVWIFVVATNTMKIRRKLGEIVSVLSIVLSLVFVVFLIFKH